MSARRSNAVDGHRRRRGDHRVRFSPFHALLGCRSTARWRAELTNGSIEAPHRHIRIHHPGVPNSPGAGGDQGQLQSVTGDLLVGGRLRRCRAHFRTGFESKRRKTGEGRRRLPVTSSRGSARLLISAVRREHRHRLHLGLPVLRCRPTTAPPPPSLRFWPRPPAFAGFCRRHGRQTPPNGGSRLRRTPPERGQLAGQSHPGPGTRQ